MSLPLAFPYAPMEAESTDTLPSGPGWQFEPKWDGFRCLAFRDETTVRMQSKAGKPLGRYFPDVVESHGCSTRHLLAPGS
jgi:ATP-dependent DNA ligase